MEESEDRKIDPLTSLEGVRAWLGTQPRNVCTVFVARAALRVVPVLSELIGETEKASEVILSSLRAMASTLSAGRWPNKAVLVVAATAASDAVNSVAETVSVADIAANAVFGTALISARAAYAANITGSFHRSSIVSDVATDAAHATTAIAIYPIAAATARAAIYAEYQDDRQFIDGGGTAEALTALPLWQAEEMPKHLKSNWLELRQYLEDLKQDWEVWIDWYEDRLAGKALIEVIEIGADPENGAYGRVTFPPEDYQDPAIINPKIKAVIKAYEKGQKWQKIFDAYSPSYGLTYTIQPDVLKITASGINQDDRVVAEDQNVKSQFKELQSRIRDLRMQCSGHSELNWGKLENYSVIIADFFNRDYSQIISEIIMAHTHMVAIAQFLDRDKDLQETPEGNQHPLLSETRRMLKSVVTLGGPWLRKFPTALREDEGIGGFFNHPELYEPSRKVLEVTQSVAILSDEDRQLLNTLISALNRSGSLSAKTGKHGAGSVRNLIVQASGIIASFYFGATASSFGDESVIVQKSSRLLLQAEADVLALMKDAPDDIRNAVTAVLEDLRRQQDGLADMPDPIAIVHPTSDDP